MGVEVPRRARPFVALVARYVHVSPQLGPQLFKFQGIYVYISITLLLFSKESLLFDLASIGHRRGSDLDQETGWLSPACLSKA